MRLYGDHHDVTLILQLGSHRYPTHPRTRPRTQARKKPPQIPILTATRKRSTAVSTLSSH